MRPMIARLFVVTLVALASPAVAFDAGDTFKQGSKVLSLEGGFGHQSNFGDLHDTGLNFWNAGARLGYLPFSPVGPGLLHGSVEFGVEPFYQRYYDPGRAFFAGLGVTGRHHFLSLGPVVPYVEVMGAAGGTDLKVIEIRSSFTFLVQGGTGLEVLVTDHMALYGGYRIQHVSNGNTSRPNRGFESHGAAFGVSVFLP